MKSAALILGIIGGLLAMIVGFFVYGYTVAIDTFGEVPDLFEQANNPARLRAIGLISPILAIAGGAMAVLRPRIAAALLAVATLGIWWGLGFGVFTMFPISMCGLAAILALSGAATKEPGGMPGS